MIRNGNNGSKQNMRRSNTRPKSIPSLTKTAATKRAVRARLTRNLLVDGPLPHTRVTALRRVNEC